MRTFPNYIVADQALASSMIPIDLDVVEATELARSLAESPAHPRPQVVIDCSNLTCLHTLGVSHVVTQLLTLRQGGVSVWLRNVDPVLQRCLHMLHLDQLFPLA